MELEKFLQVKSKIGANLAVKIKQLLHWEEKLLPEPETDLNLFSA